MSMTRLVDTEIEAIEPAWVRRHILDCYAEEDRLQSELASLKSSQTQGGLRGALEAIRKGGVYYNCGKCGWIGKKPDWRGMPDEEDPFCPNTDCPTWDDVHGGGDVMEASAEDIAEMALASPPPPETDTKAVEWIKRLKEGLEHMRGYLVVSVKTTDLLSSPNPFQNIVDGLKKILDETETALASLPPQQGPDAKEKL